MDRTLILDCLGKIDQEVTVAGWVHTRRDHGRIIFLDVYDRSGTIQVIAPAENLAPTGPQDVVKVTGVISKRPENLVNPNLSTGTVELQASRLEVLSKAEELPFDMGGKDLELQLPTLLDFRSLTLRHPKVKAIFKVQAAILESFREIGKELDCREVVVPTISASATEGGAEVFKVDYFDKKAFLTQSPQLYKQMMVPVFERVFTISKAYRAEASVTTRHLTEATQMDFEFGFVDFNDLLDLLEKVSVEILRKTSQKCQDILQEFGIDQPKLARVPRLKLQEAQEIIFKEFGRDARGEKDLNPQDEVDISKWALEKHQSDLVIITHFPTAKRAFYTMPDPENPEFSLSYDVLFRGVEILSGSQRINNYQTLIEAIKGKGMDPQNFQMYLLAFKYGMPPEGGFSFGLERITMHFLNLANVREASLFPRDMERVDVRLSTLR